MSLLRRLAEKKEKFIPAYANLPLILVACSNFLVYYGCRMINLTREHYDLTIPLDASIPFLPWFAAFYLLAYVQWISGYLLIGKEGKDFCYRWCFASIAGKLLAGICFLIIPSTAVRPEAAGNGFFEMLIRMIYAADLPDNLFPSIHCLESWICFRSSCYMKKIPRWVPAAFFVMTLLVFASTVCTKQHVLIDIAGGILAAEAGLLIVDRIRAKR